MSKLKIVAGALAGVVMVGSLTYYNFIDKAIPQGVEVGATCPNFVVPTYKVEDGEFKVGGETFSLSGERALHPEKVIVINFWATYCGPCKAELPEFDQFQKAYKDDVTVITLDGEVSISAEKLATWMNTNKDAVGWEDFEILFGRYEESQDNVYTKLGFSSGALPATLVVDTEGVIAFKKEGSMHYEDLVEIVTPLFK
jgi:thiol-disulfide isomerase/thioredoxin